MKRTLTWVLPLLALILTVLSFDCTLKNCAVNLPNTASTPTPTCTSYLDDYSVNTLGNYDVYNEVWNPKTAPAESILITSGEFQVAPPSVTVSPFIMVNNSFFTFSLGDYTVEGDFNLGTVGQGVFGLIFRATPASGQGYIFQWNGLNSRWEIEKQTAPTLYYYPATNTSSPYTLGTLVHLKVVVGPGNLFNAYITPGAGPQQQIFTGVVDPGTTTPYTAGGAGIRAYNIVGGNILHVDNFSIKTPACP